MVGCQTPSHLPDRPNLSPSTVEKGEDSLGAVPKFPVSPTTCDARSINAQSSLWTISGGVIPGFRHCWDRHDDGARPSVDLSPSSVDKDEDSMRAGGKSCFISTPCRACSRKAQTRFNRAGFSPPNVDKPEDSLPVLCQKPCRSSTCRVRARIAHRAAAAARGMRMRWDGGQADRLVPMECGQASEQSHNKYRNSLCDSHLRGVVKQ